MKTDITVSVIMPIYNAEKTVVRAIKSILNQKYSDFELLIIDDYSSDRSMELVSRIVDDRIKVHKNRKNIGSLKSRNILFEKANGKYIIFQDADDSSEPNRIFSLVNYMNENKEVFLCGSNVNFYNEKNKLSHTSSKELIPDLVKKKFSKEIPIIFASSIIRKEVLNKIGGFRTAFFDLGNYDYDWMYRISEKYKCANIKEPLYNVYRLSNSNSITVSNPYKVIGNELVQFLAEQRKIEGVDYIDKNELEKFYAYAKELHKPYENDPSLFLFKRIQGTISEKMYMKAVKLSIQAIILNPKSIKNYKTLIYCIKAMISN